MNTSIAYFAGKRLVETTAIKKKVQRRTHKKRRINKKWLKRYGYKDVPDDNTVLVLSDCIYATPKMVKRIIKELKGGAK